VSVAAVAVTAALAAAIEHKTLSLSVAEFLPDARRDRRQRITRHVLLIHLLVQVPIGISPVEIIKARIMVIPLMNDCCLAQDKVDEVPHKRRIPIVEVLVHLPLFVEGLRIPVVKIPANECEHRVLGCRAREGLHRLPKVLYSLKISQDDEIEVS
jgi:hypothetical protein